MKNAKILFGTLAMGLVALLAIPAQARMFHRANRVSSDQSFVTKAAEGGMAEVQMAQLAQSKATNQAVKDLANRLVTDHAKANNDLKPIAVKEGETLPTAMNAKDQAEHNKLQGLSGAGFDREYINNEIRDHKETISMFQHEVDHGTNPDVKAWASQNLPTLREHLRMAESARMQLSK